MQASSGGTRRFEVNLTDEALYGYSDVQPDSVYERVGELICLLS